MPTMMRIRYALVLVSLLTVGCRGCQQSSWTAADVSMSLASIPAQMCVAVNEARPEILRLAGDSLHARAVSEGWLRAQEEEALTALHDRDSRLRDIVSPNFTRQDGTGGRGTCRVVTETMESLSVGVDRWEAFDEDTWQDAVAQTLRVIDEVINTLEALGVTDFYGWLSEHGEVAGVDLGNLMHNFMRWAAILLERGSAGLMGAGEI